MHRTPPRTPKGSQVRHEPPRTPFRVLIPTIGAAIAAACGTTFYAPSRLPSPVSGIQVDTAAMAIPPAERYLSVRLFTTSEPGPWTAPLQRHLKRFRQFAASAVIIPASSGMPDPVLPFGLDLTSTPPTLTVEPSAILLGSSPALVADTARLVLTVVASDESRLEETLSKVTQAFRTLTGAPAAPFAPAALLDSARVALGTLFRSASITIRADLLSTLAPQNPRARVSHTAYIILPSGIDARPLLEDPRFGIRTDPVSGGPELLRGGAPFVEFPWLLLETRVEAVRDIPGLGRSTLPCGSQPDRAVLGARAGAVRALLDRTGASLLSPSQYALERQVSSWLDRLAELGSVVGQRDTFLTVYASSAPPRLVNVPAWLGAYAAEHQNGLEACYRELRRTGGGSIIAQTDLAREAMATLRDTTPDQLPLRRVVMMFDGMESLWMQLGPDTTTAFPRALRAERRALATWLLGQVEQVVRRGPDRGDGLAAEWRETLGVWSRSSCAPCAQLAARTLAAAGQMRSDNITRLLTRTDQVITLAHGLHERLCGAEPDSAIAVRALEDSVYLWRRKVEMLPPQGFAEGSSLEGYTARTEEAATRLQWLLFASRPGTPMMENPPPDQSALRCLETTRHFGPMA